MCIFHITHMVLLSLAAARFPPDTLFCSTPATRVTGPAVASPINSTSDDSTVNYTSTTTTSNSAQDSDPEVEKAHYGGLIIWPVILMSLDVLYLIRFFWVYYRVSLYLISLSAISCF